MKKYFIVIISLLFFVGFLVLAEDLSEIGYPVPELGDCSSQEKCKVYCDDISHLEECINFAERHSLIPLEELEESKKIITAINKGIEPPPCNSKAECDIYCSEPEHMEMCVAFAEAAGVLSPEELEEAKKVLSGIKKGVKHPNCRGKEQCDIYCCGPAHMEECVSFAEAAGLISPSEAIMMRKTGGESPGGCCGKKACDAYCDDPAHMQECIRFANKYGLMPKKEAEMAMKMLEAGLTGGPGGCNSQEECNAYCNDLAHMQECIDFALKAGFITEEEAEQSLKMTELGITTGPGNCQSKEECEIYCENPDNIQECIGFGEKMGIITSKEKETMIQGGPGGCMGEKECESYCKDPIHIEECIKFGTEQGFISPEEAEEMIKGGHEFPTEGEILPGEMPLPKEGFYGPGGCITKEECEAYCSQPEHFEECGFQRGELMKTPGEHIPPPEEIEPYKSEPMKTPGEHIPPPEEVKSSEETIPIIPSSEEKPIIEEKAPQTFLDLLPKFLADMIAIFLETK